jgi:hypothetical protein
MSDIEREPTEEDLSLDEDQTEEVSGGLARAAEPVERESPSRPSADRPPRAAP